MHIIYLHQYFVTPEYSGATRSYELARRLVAAGHTVDMITTDQEPSRDASAWRITDEDGIRVHWNRQPYNNSMGWFERIRAFFSFAISASRRAASIRDADVIFATSTPLTIAVPAIFASWRLRKPYIFEVRDIWPAAPIALGKLNNPFLQWIAKVLEHVAYHRAKHVIALAPGMGDEVAKTGYPYERITIIPNGCDTDIFADTHVTDGLGEYKKWLGNHPMILYAGTLAKLANVGYIVEIAREMLDLNPDVRFVIIGAGSERDAIRQQATDLGVLDRNLKIVNAVPKRDLAAWLQRASLCLAMFGGPRFLWKDAVQNKFFDALAAGKPVISNQPGWQCKIAEEHDVGKQMPPDDPAAAANLLLIQITDEAWLKDVSARAKKLATGQFSRDYQAGMLEKCLMKVVSASAD